MEEEKKGLQNKILAYIIGLIFAVVVIFYLAKIIYSWLFENIWIGIIVFLFLIALGYILARVFRPSIKKKIKEIGGSSFLNKWILAFIQNFTRRSRKKEKKLALARVPLGKVYTDIKDRILGLFITGSPGSGKTTTIIRMIFQDLLRKIGNIIIIDRKGDICSEFYTYLKDNKKFIFFDVSRDDCPKYNPLEIKNPELSYKFAKDFNQIIDKIHYPQEQTSTGAEHYKNWTFDLIENSIIALSEAKGIVKFKDMERLITEKDFQEEILGHIKNKEAINFFKEFRSLDFENKRDKSHDALDIIRSFNDPVLGKIVNEKSDFRIDDIMNSKEKRGIFIDLSARGKVAEETLDLLGSLFIAQIQQVLMERNVKEPNPLVILYIDEVQNYITQAFLKFFAEGRAYGIALNIAFQSFSQLKKVEGLKEQVFLLGNLLCFAMPNPEDSQILSKYFGYKNKIEKYYDEGRKRYRRINLPRFMPNIIQELPSFSMILRLKKGANAPTFFRAEALPPLKEADFLKLRDIK